MGIGTDKLDPASAVVSLLGNRKVAEGVYETVQIALDQIAALFAPAAIRAVFASKAEMDIALGYTANAGAEVHADPTAANNGLYRKVGASGGGAWLKVSDLSSQAMAAQLAALQLLVATHTGGIAALDGALLNAASTALSKVEALADTSRPGDAPHCFTAQLDGSADTAPVLTLPQVITLRGAAVRMAGAGKIATRGPRYVEDTACRVRFIFRRAVDTDDPANDAVRLGIRWLKADQSGLDATVIEDLIDITEAAGRLHYSYVVGKTSDAGVDVIAPAGAVYARPFLQCFGGGETEIEVLEWTSLADAVDWSPDVTAFERSVSGFAYQLEALGVALSELRDTVNNVVQRAEQSSFQKVTGDTDFAVAASEDTKTVLHTATLTQPRNLTLMRTGARDGSRINVTRSGGGPFNLSIRDGASLKQLAAGTWADFVFDDGAWRLRAAGTL